MSAPGGPGSVRLSAAHPALAGATGAGVRVAVIDSGVAPGHPHVRTVAPGVSMVGDDMHDTLDRLGHGTAVAAAIRERASDAELVPVRVLDRTLATSARLLARAITWAVDDGAQLVNLSFGTVNAEHVPLFEEALAHAAALGALVVAAARQDATVWYPGSLAGAVGVVADAAMPRGAVGLSVEAPGATRLVASPYPRPIDGVPVERNLSGVSFAVANATGLLALAVERGAPTSSWDALGAWIAGLPDAAPA